MALGRVRVGTSGFNYPHWRGVLYPPGLAPSRWLGHYARHFDIVELNVTFYRLPRREAFEGWARLAPAGFEFTLKGSRFITHVRRLKEATEPLQRLWENAEPLGRGLAVVLWQLPPRFRADVGRLEAFLDALGHVGGWARVRQAFEFRDLSWFTDPVMERLARHDAAVALADWPFVVEEGGAGPAAAPTPPDRPLVRVPATAGWVYVRRHGPGRPYTQSYPDEELARDAERIRRWAEAGRDVYCLFNNDVGGYAVANARRLRELVGLAGPAGPAHPA